MGKAFVVTEDYENRAMVVFADHAIVARRIVASEYRDGELGGIRVNRARGLDQYCGEGVPARALIEMGWWFDCTGCNRTINLEYLDENDLPLDGVAGYEKGQVFCGTVCQHDHVARKERERASGQEFLSMLRQRVLKRFGHVEFVTGAFLEHVFAQETEGQVIIRQASVAFNFPGQKIAPASLHYDPGYNIGPAKLELRCCAGDQPAFEAWASSAPTADQMGG